MAVDEAYGAGLRALGLNCTLKRSPEESNTEALMRRVTGLLEDHGAETEIVRPVDYAIAFGITSDEGDGDEWPQVLDKITAHHEKRVDSAIKAFVAIIEPAMTIIMGAVVALIVSSLIMPMFAITQVMK